MNTLNKALTGAVFLVAAATSLLVRAEWTSVEHDATDDSYSVYVQSERFNNTMLAVLASEEYNCKPIMMVIGGYDKKLVEDTYEIEGNMRIDQGKVHDIQIFRTQEKYSFEHEGNFYITRVLEMVMPDSDVMAEVILGNKLIYRNEVDTETDEFSLDGSSRAINNVISSCKGGSANHAEWGGDEWSSDTGSTSDDSEWTL